MRSFQTDYYAGLAGELASYAALKGLSGTYLSHSKDPFADFDFFSTDCVIELKTRNCFFDNYEDCMIQMLKVMKASQICDHKDVYFAFRYFDGLYYIKYDPEKFSKYKIHMVKVPDRDGYTEKPEPRMYIPIKDLTLLQRIVVLE